MDMIQPQYNSLPPAELRQTVEGGAENAFIRLRFEGLDFDGDEVSKLVMLNLGKPGTAEDRLREAGIGVMMIGDEAQVSDVTYGSEAARYGVDFGMNITEVLLPNTNRWPKEILFIPALALIVLVYFVQRRRRPADEPAKA
jgi:hypothetical protein